MSEALAYKVKQGEGCNLTVFNRQPDKDDGFGDFKQNTAKKVQSKPIWMSALLYLMLAAIGMSWLLRIFIQINAVGANIFMRKVILR